MRKSVDRGFPKHIKDFGGIHDNIVAAFKYVLSFIFLTFARWDEIFWKGNWPLSCS